MRRIVTICGSTRFVDVMAALAWEEEKAGGRIVLSCHLLPEWYGAGADHQAEAEGVAAAMDLLHLVKVEMADEVLVVDCDRFGRNRHIGASTQNEIADAKSREKVLRVYSVERQDRTPYPWEVEPSAAAPLAILKHPHPMLRRRCAPVPFPLAAGPLLERMDKMRELLLKAGGIGLAAPQVGWDARAFVMTNQKGSYLYVFNPAWSYDEDAGFERCLEGCLSIPGLTVIVRRPKAIRAVYYTAEGERREHEMHGREARVFMHESDHLDGVLITDRRG